MRVLISCLILAFGTVAGLASASPLWQVKGGQTSIEFSETFASALSNCDLDRIKPAVYKAGDARVRTRVVGGAVDTATVSGEAFHAGGFTVSCPAMGDGPSLSLQSLIIDLPPETDSPVITGLVTVSGGMEPVLRGRLPLFNVSIGDGA